MEQYGNTTTYNMESVLAQNIKRSQYWEKRAKDIVDWAELVDEVYETVENVEPWMSGNARGPSTAFNLLYRLCQLKPEVAEIRQMLDHRDSPYIRAIGLLYLRYVCDPRQLWDWFKHYIRDEEEFSPSPPDLGHPITIGEFARDILLDQFYFETIFPRVPKPVHDDICGHLKDMGLPTKHKGNAGQGGGDRRGVNEGSARPASVKASLSVAFGQRAPNRAGAREQGRGMGSDQTAAAGGATKRSPSPYKRQEERPAARAPERYDRDERKERDFGRRDDKREERRPDDRRRDDRDRRDARPGDRRDYRQERQYGKQDDRGYRRDERGGRDERDRRERRRSRSRDRQRSASRDARDVFRDRAAPVHKNPDIIRETYG